MSDREEAVLVPKSIFVCDHCDEINFDSYMVLDRVWFEAMPTRRGKLHLICLEAKLGRHLVLGDFTPAKINDMLRFGYQLAKREEVPHA